MGYGIVIRVWGDYALFTRPEMKVERVTYDMITPSAARGIIEAVYWKPAIRWMIDRIHVMREPEFTNVRRNEVSAKASASLSEMQQAINGKKTLYIDSTVMRQQRAALVLKNVEYYIAAHFDLVPEKAGPEDTVEKHYNMALRRLRNGQFFHAPCLGTREFGAKVELVEWPVPPSPLAGVRDLGWMLYDLDFADAQDIRPKFFKAELLDGVLDLKNVQPRE